ncbi:MAG: hypothetical protein ACOVLE_00660 [Pirellula staleyi]
MKYSLSKDGIRFDDVEYGSFISAVSSILDRLNEGETFYVGKKNETGSNAIFDEIRKYVLKNGKAVWVREDYPDDYENEPRLEYENEFGEPWDFSPMDLLGLLIAWFVFLLLVYLVAVNQK